MSLREEPPGGVAVISISTGRRARRLVAVSLVTAMVVAAWPAGAAPAPGSARGRLLERAAVDLAVRLRAVPVRDGGFADPGRY